MPDADRHRHAMLFPSDHACREGGKAVPAPALCLLFFVYPVIQTVQYPLTERDGHSAEYADVGLRSFTRLATGDDTFTSAAGNNLTLTVTVNLAQTALGRLLARWLIRTTRAPTLLRAVRLDPLQSVVRPGARSHGQTAVRQSPRSTAGAPPESLPVGPSACTGPAPGRQPLADVASMAEKREHAVVVHYGTPAAHLPGGYVGGVQVPVPGRD
ncbi:hypothetical protein [Streptomyces althioticus]|uniref:hypothetical protein n=1 Tax=Streptomyces althioticus TaxID=83380 RepID=UPI0036FB78BD